MRQELISRQDKHNLGFQHEKNNYNRATPRLQPSSLQPSPYDRYKKLAAAQDQLKVCTIRCYQHKYELMDYIDGSQQ